MADFATLTDLKAALDITDGSQDTLLTTLTGVATQMLIDVMNRDPRADDFVERANGLGSTVILVNQYPINSVASVAIDGNTLDPSLVDFDDNVVFLKVIAPRGRRNVTVSYNAGLDPLPKTIKQAAIYTVRALLTSRKVNLNSTGDSWAGVSSESWYADGAGTVPQAAKTLLSNYVRRVLV